MLSSERERIAYRVTPLSDIRRVVRVKAEKREREVVDEGGSLGNGPRCNKKRERKMTEEREVTRSSRKLEIF